MSAAETAGRSPDPVFAARLAKLLGSAPVYVRRVAGGYSPAERLLVTLEDGTSAFVKAATTPEAHDALVAEGRVYETVRGSFLPRRLAFDATSPAVPVLEDLSGAHWPPPWRPGDVEAVREALDRLHAATAPPGLPRLAGSGEMRSGWARVAADPAPFLSLGMASAAWIEAALPALRRAEAEAPLDGSALLHQDVRSDNLALTRSGVRLVDWNWAAVGNPDADLAFWLPSLATEGGPRPSEVYRGDPRLAAVVSGWFASSAGLPTPPGAPRVREVQRRQLEAALPWAAEALGLPSPDGAAAVSAARTGTVPSEPVLAALRRIAADARHPRPGRGVAALFVGESATGGLEAARVPAQELGVALRRVDLSALVSKYIGETEKDLDRVFDTAEGGGLLFFDEADALFGKRTEVRDSHDRFANIEVSNLLQRMEAHDGIAILAVTRKPGVDPALLRRFRHVVELPLLPP